MQELKEQGQVDFIAKNKKSIPIQPIIAPAAIQ